MLRYCTPERANQSLPLNLPLDRSMHGSTVARNLIRKRQDKLRPTSTWTCAALPSLSSEPLNRTSLILRDFHLWRYRWQVAPVSCGVMQAICLLWLC